MYSLHHAQAGAILAKPKVQEILPDDQELKCRFAQAPGPSILQILIFPEPQKPSLNFCFTKQTLNISELAMGQKPELSR